METHLTIIGYLFIILALLHYFLPKYANWKSELSLLNIFNQQIMQVHTFFIAFTVFSMGILCISSQNELVNTILGRRICLGLGVFWLIRLFVQFFVYSTKLWKGKTFETVIHILASLLWIYLSYVFLKIGIL